MSLFPAYASKDETHVESERLILKREQSPEAEDSSNMVSPAVEIQLLASSESEAEEPLSMHQPQLSENDFYTDNKLDYGNLRVSTLYYPGRPEYEVCSGTMGASVRGERAGRRRGARRYWQAPRAADAEPHAELAARTAALQRALADDPHDEQLWIRFIDFQEAWVGAGAALAAAEAGVTRLPRAASLRARRHAAARRALSADEYLTRLRDEIATEKCLATRTELWVRLLVALADAGGAGGAPAIAAAAAAALGDLRHYAPAYNHIFFIYGTFLRSAGLWEQLVLLLELVTAMNYSPAGFPPPPDTERVLRLEASLQEYEDKVMSSGLPSSTVWTRVERARAAAHWRPADRADPADPQRAPLPADVAELLAPVVGDGARFALAVHALRLAKVPVLPAAGYALSALAAGVPGAVHDHHARDTTCGEALLALLRAARRLAPAHPARPRDPALARRTLAQFVDPPHYFADDNGYLDWVNSLWDACCEWTAGERRAAMLCWRLRWLHALALAAEGAEVRRVRGAARAALRRFAGEHPLPFAQHARLELAAAGAAAAQRVALHALRAALQRCDTYPSHYALYVARIVDEVSGRCGAAPGAVAAWAYACAALGRPMPPDPSNAPPRELLAQALLECENRCAALERQLETEREREQEEAHLAFLPTEAEWGAARVALAAPRRRRELRARLHASGAARSAAAARYAEQTAAALAAAAGRLAAGSARALAPLHPHNALLSLLSSGAPLWARDELAPRTPSPAPRLAGLAALAAAWPLVLRAVDADWAPDEAERLCRAVRRAQAAGEGAELLWALRLAGEAHARRPRLAHALYAALDAAPNDKWIYVRGAEWRGGEAGALADAMLERALRLHALPQELDAFPQELPSLPQDQPALEQELPALPQELHALPQELHALPLELRTPPGAVVDQ